MDRIILPCPSCGQRNAVPADKQHLGPRCARCGTPLELAGHGIPVELDAENFDHYLASLRTPVLIFLYSTTCGYCARMAPVMDRMASRYAGRLGVGKLDVNRYPRIAARFNLRGVPLLLLFRNNTPIQRFEGAVPEPHLVGVIESLI